jgi:hypothetical protein
MNECARQKVMFIFSSITYITMKNIRLRQGLIIMMYYSCLISVTIYVCCFFFIIIIRLFTYVPYSDNVLLFFFSSYPFSTPTHNDDRGLLPLLRFYVVNNCLHLIVYCMYNIGVDDKRNISWSQRINVFVNVNQSFSGGVWQCYYKKSIKNNFDKMFLLFLAWVNDCRKKENKYYISGQFRCSQFHFLSYSIHLLNLLEVVTNVHSSLDCTLLFPLCKKKSCIIHEMMVI